MSAEERVREERRLRLIASPSATIRHLDVRARLENFGGIRNTEQAQVRQIKALASAGRPDGVPMASTAPDSVEKLPFFERSVLNSLAESPRFVKRQGNFLVQSFSIGTVPFLIREREKRLYFLIQSTAAVNSIFLGFDFIPSLGNGVLLVAGAIYEPIQVPTNDIWIVGAGANTTGLIIYSIE